MEKIYRSFYTKSDPIVSYMINRLTIKDGLKILEPCAGDGVFVDALTSQNKNITIDVLELNPKAIQILKEKYENHENIKIKETDMLTDPDLLWYSNVGGIYDRIIANPPYGGWLDYQKRKILKELYPYLYVKETYSLFLYRCIHLLKEKGILVFIIPDTFLNLHMHTKFREFILTNTKIKELVLFPSSFFPGVNFGYSNLSIITLERCADKTECLENIKTVITGFKRVEQLAGLIKNEKKELNIYRFKQGVIFRNIDHGLFINGNKRVADLINRGKVRIGDIAECVTGFYSGNDRKYLKVLSRDVKRAKKYEVVGKEIICDNFVEENNLLAGIEDNKHFVPIVKGGGSKVL